MTADDRDDKAGRDWYAPNQQAVRADGSGPAEEGTGGPRAGRRRRGRPTKAEAEARDRAEAQAKADEKAKAEAERERKA